MKKHSVLCWLLMTVALTLGFVACSESDEEVKIYQLFSTTQRDLPLVEANSITWSWKASAETPNYAFQVSTDAEYTNFIVDLPTTTEISYKATMLDYETKYYARVKCLSPDGPEYDSAWMELSSATTAARVVPAVLNAVDMAKDWVDLAVTFSWDNTYKVTRLVIKGAEGTEFEKEIALTDADRTAGKVTVEGFDFTGSFIATLWNDNEPFEADREYNSVAFSVSVSVVENPVELNRPDIQNNSVTWSWRAVAGAEKYAFQISTAADFATTVVDIEGAETTYTAAELNYKTTYYARVKALSPIHSQFDSEWVILTEATTTDRNIPIVLAAPDMSKDFANYAITFNWDKTYSVTRLVIKGIEGTEFEKEVTLTDDDRAAGKVTVEGFNTEGTFSATIWNDNESFEADREYNTVTFSLKFVKLGAVTENGKPVTEGNTAIWSWNASTETDKYAFQISSDAEFATIVVDVPSTTETSYTAAELEYSTTYYARVKCLSQFGSDYDSEWTALSTVSLNYILGLNENLATAVENAQPGATLILPRGYSVEMSDLVIIGKDITIRGAKEGEFGQTGARPKIISNTHVFRITGELNNVTLSGFDMKYQSGKNVFCIGLYSVNLKNLTIEDCSAVNYTNGFMTTENKNAATIGSINVRNCFIDNIDRLAAFNFTDNNMTVGELNIESTIFSNMVYGIIQGSWDKLASHVFPGNLTFNMKNCVMWNMCGYNDGGVKSKAYAFNFPGSTNVKLNLDNCLFTKSNPQYQVNNIALFPEGDTTSALTCTNCFHGSDFEVWKNGTWPTNLTNLGLTDVEIFVDPANNDFTYTTDAVRAQAPGTERNWK